nr:Dihydrofolate reductase [uncultured bacterium]
MKPTISMIVAMSENRVIGHDGGIPWKIPGEQKRFKEITMGHPMIMGRKTYESIGRPLPGRTNIVVTHDVTRVNAWQNEHKQYAQEIVPSLKDAIDKAMKSPGSDEMFIIGGGQLFEEGLKDTDRIYLTIIHKDMDGDVFFPEYRDFKEVSREEHEFDGLHYSYILLER